MSYSLNEIEALAKRAARCAGLSWGLAEEAGTLCPISTGATLCDCSNRLAPATAASRELGAGSRDSYND